MTDRPVATGADSIGHVRRNRRTTPMPNPVTISIGPATCRYQNVMRAALLASAAVLAMASIALADEPGLRARVRGMDPTVQRLIADGYARSATFRDLIDRLDALDWFVFVVRGRCPRREEVGCLLHDVSRYESRPSIRIVIDQRRHRSRDREIATMAHELCHALEVASDPLVGDSTQVTSLFERIGKLTDDSSGVRAFETEAAARTGRKVRQELLNGK
jgi:hypothetical protein